MAINNQDFIEVEYTGRTKAEGFIFDTTDKKVAEENGLGDDMKFGAVVICVGEGHLIRGLDEQLPGKEAGKTYTIEIPM